MRYNVPDVDKQGKERLRDGPPAELLEELRRCLGSTLAETSFRAGAFLSLAV